MWTLLCESQSVMAMATEQGEDLLDMKIIYSSSLILSLWSSSSGSYVLWLKKELSSTSILELRILVSAYGNMTKLRSLQMIKATTQLPLMLCSLMMRDLSRMLSRIKWSWILSTWSLMLKDLLDGGSLILLCKAISSYGYLRCGPVENPMFLVEDKAVYSWRDLIHGFN